MTAVFVHGVPETSQIWDGVRRRLATESVALALPGFGTPRPPGFAASKDAYAAWVADTLSRIEGPIDLVGHDWGALLALRVATAFAVSLRSWAVDVANVFHPAFVWHAAAQTWQTPGAGEQWMQAARAAPPGSAHSTAARLARSGVPAAEAAAMGAAHDETMSQCILDLYRSSVPNVSAEWGGDVKPTRAPGLVLLLPDPVEADAMSREMARRLGAQTARLDGLHHCWMAEAPETTTTILQRFWSSLGERQQHRE